MSEWSDPGFAERFGVEHAGERTLQIAFERADDAPPPGAVLAQRAQVDEAISSPWRITLHALCVGRWYQRDGDKTVHDGTQPHPEQFVGQLARVTVQAEERSRVFDGVVTAARQLGHWTIRENDFDGFDLVELIVEPTLALLAYRHNSRVFHEKCQVEVALDVIEEHIGNNPVMACGMRLGHPRPGPTRARSYLTQYDESDLAFVERLFATSGVNYTLPHTAEQPFGHTLDLFGPDHVFPQEAIAVLGTLGHDVGLPLRHWRGRRQLVIPRTRLSSHDYKGAAAEADNAGRDRFAFRGAAGSFGEYAALAPNARPPRTLPYPSWTDAQIDWDARVRQSAQDQSGEVYEGETTAPLPLAAVIRVQGPSHAAHSRLGESDGKDHHAAANYVVTRQRLIVRTPMHPELRGALDKQAPDLDVRCGVDLFNRLSGENAPPVLSTFEACPRALPIAPEPARLCRTSPGAVTATVVGQPGADGQVVHTDELGRIAVRMHWQRDLAWHAGGPLHGDGEPTTWLRYVQPGAGDGIGFQYLPRVGDEVLVIFLHGDPDRPVIIGSLYNHQHLPPAFGGKGALPGNDVLTGLRTREHGGAGGNELCMDDSHGEVGVRLASSTASSGLTLGHIATPRADGKATARGEGAELRTTGLTAVRAEKGLLLSTFAAPVDAEHTSHLKASELVEVSKTLSDAAAARIKGATLPRLHDSGDVSGFKALPSWDNGAKEPLSAIVSSANGPVLSLASDSHLIHSNVTTDIVAGSNVQLIAGNHISHVAMQGITLHSQDDGIRSVAETGDIVASAVRGNVRVNADGDIELKARQTIRLHAENVEIVTKDGSYISLNDAIELGTKGRYTVKSDQAHLRAKAAHPLDFTPPADQNADACDVDYGDLKHDELLG